MKERTDNKEKMASMLELPRELYLMICDCLSPRDLARLARVTKDHYLATQQPLFKNIKITAFGNLVKLVHTITKPPIVSTISRKQRLRWQSLSDAQLREREIRQLDIVMTHGSKDASKVTGAVLSRCIGAISRCNNRPKITLTLHGSWYHLLQQLQTVPLLDVRTITIYLGQHGTDPLPGPRNRCMHLDPGFELWNLCFEGSSFPDLHEVSINTLHISPEELPATINEGAGVVVGQPRAGHNLNGDSASFSPFHGLRNMTTVKLRYNDFFNTNALYSLFGSNIIPQKLKRLEIVNCPALNSLDNLEALSTLLERSLQLLEHLQLHLQRGSDWYVRLHQYRKDIEEEPDWHLCSVVCKMGQHIKSLDLAVPFACSDIFVPVDKASLTMHGQREYPDIPRTPHSTLPDRVMAAGYKYRRLICRDGICKPDQDWDQMADLAGMQQDRTSWEIVGPIGQASWHVGGCLPIPFNSQEVLDRELEMSER